MGRLDFNDLTGEYIFKCKFDERHYAKAAGFKFIEETGLWTTTEVRRANNIRQFSANLAVERQILRLTGQFEPDDITWPKNRQDPFPIKYKSRSGKYTKGFQSDAIRFILDHKNTYVGDDMGLGKTAEAIVATSVAQIVSGRSQKVLVVCPPFAINNWIQEIKDWSNTQTTEFFNTIFVVESKSDDLKGIAHADWVIIPDSIITKMRPIISDMHFDWAIIDEAHRFKDIKSGRSFSLLGGFSGDKRTKKKRGCFSKGALWNCRRVVMLSGTPILNRHMEIFPIVNRLCPEAFDFMDEFKFGREYCGGKRVKIKRWGKPDLHVWDFTGSTKGADLNKRLKKHFMIRRFKEDVLKELPEKTRQIIELSSTVGARKQLNFEKKSLKKVKLTDILNDPLSLTDNLATARRLIGIEMAKASIEYVENVLDSNRDRKIILYAYHTEVIDILAEQLFQYDPIIIDGRYNRHQKHENEKLFRDHKQRRLLIGQITACGLALNFQCANFGLFIEGSYVMEENKQAEDRMWRQNQKNAVHIQYLKFKDSLYDFILTKNFNKESIIKEALG